MTSTINSSKPTTKPAFIFKLLRPNAPDIPMPALSKYLTSTPQGPEKLATILSQEAKQLMAMDRYEKRALSRRKFAIREFDTARCKPEIMKIGMHNACASEMISKLLQWIRRKSGDRHASEK